MSETASELFARAVEARIARQFAETVRLFKAALALQDRTLSVKHRRVAYAQAVKYATRVGDWPEAEAIARAGMAAFPEMSYLHQGLGEALMQLGRAEEAEAVLRRGLELNPELDGARALLAMLANRGRDEAVAQQVRAFPTRVSAFENPAAVIKRYLLRARPRDPFIQPGTAFLTLGSCFAQNLAARLRLAGYPCHSEEIGEEVNSTYANRYLMDWIENGPVDGPTRAMDEAFGPASRERLRRGFASSQVFVMTLGVAASFFNADGAFAFIPQHARTTADALSGLQMRTTTVAENVENVGRIIDAVRRLAGPQVRIVLTVSPVPMSATTEFDSAITADCISKSTLRLACHEVVSARSGEGVLYWPSFEIVRWMGTHFGPEVPPVYGGDDGNPRHVSAWLVDEIVGQFLKFHAGQPA